MFEVHKIQRIFQRELPLYNVVGLQLIGIAVSLIQKKKYLSVQITRAFKLIFGRDPVILFMSIENPGDRLACSILVRRGSCALFRPRTSYVILYPREIYPPQCSVLVPPYWFKLLIANLSSTGGKLCLMVRQRRAHFSQLFIYRAHIKISVDIIR